MHTRKRSEPDVGSTPAIANLPNLGPKSAEALSEVGIYTRADLERFGPIAAYLALEAHQGRQPSLNFLYAMVGALKGESWQSIAQEEKYELLMELEARRESPG